MSSLRRLPVAVLACLLIALAVPALASAKTYVVDSNQDEPNETAGIACDTGAAAGEECTLRAAIEAANFNPVGDEIEFDEEVFDGSAGTSDIELVLGQLEIKAPLVIRGGVGSLGSVPKPAVGIQAGPQVGMFQVLSPGVTLENLAIGGAAVGIEDKRETLTVHGLWFGLDLEGNADPLGNGGIFISPEGDAATITSSESITQPRNVFTNAPFGIIDTSSGAKIQGNFIGVGPDGAKAANVSSPIVLGALGEDPVSGTQIGGELTASQASTPACDGPCNVIVSKGGRAISLTPQSGVKAPAGPTAIRGNYFNLAADGLGPVQGEASRYGVYGIDEGGEPGPGEVTIGGFAPTDTNYFVGGLEAIRAEGSEGLTVAGNRIGLNADNSESASPEFIAIRIGNTGVNRTAKVSRNQLVLEPDAYGIEVQDGNAELLNNQITGSEIAIRTERTEQSSEPDRGSLIEGNQINEADVDAISLGDGLNQVLGNTVANSGRFGIEVDHSVHNRIGGDVTGQANTLVGNGVEGEESGAIVVYGEETGRNEIAINTGFGNANPFIQLIGHGSMETPNALQPPVIASAGETRTTGTAVPGTTVRVFTKASADPGELGTYLGKAEADATGAWKVTYAKQADGTLVAATQTSKAGTEEAGTSALAGPSTVIFSPEEEKEVKDKEAAEREAKEKPEREAAEKADRERAEREAAEKAQREKDAASKDGGAKPNPTPVSPGPVAKVAPKVKITAQPKKSSTATTAKFKFKATNVPGAKFECKLDGGKWAGCKSPKTYKNLKAGKHDFKVRAKADGLTGAVVKFQFTVKA
jgi:hypothetical protein